MQSRYIIAFGDPTASQHLDDEYSEQEFLKLDT